MLSDRLRPVFRTIYKRDTTGLLLMASSAPGWVVRPAARHVDLAGWLATACQGGSQPGAGDCLRLHAPAVRQWLCNINGIGRCVMPFLPQECGQHHTCAFRELNRGCKKIAQHSADSTKLSPALQRRFFEGFLNTLPKGALGTSSWRTLSSTCLAPLESSSSRFSAMAPRFCDYSRLRTCS